MNPPIERLFDRVEITESCWLWTGALTYGYGNITIGGKRTGAHRASYELLVGPIPEGLQIDHLCRVRNCVNPDHLEPVTQAENVRRGVGNGYREATHCKNGHEFTPENTYVWRDRMRTCRACDASRARERYQAQLGRPVRAYVRRTAA